MKRVLITGITGFVGSHMADYILENVPGAEIYGIKRWRSRDENILHLMNNERVTFIEADLTDRGSLNRAIRMAKPDCVYHFAAQSFPGASFKSPVMTNFVFLPSLVNNIFIWLGVLFCISSAIMYALSKVLPRINPNGSMCTY